MNSCVGIDIVSIDQIQALVANTRARELVFCPEEIAWCEAQLQDALPAFARTFAIKEAAMKALQAPEGMPANIRVMRNEGRSPSIEWHRLAKAGSVSVSTSFSAPFAIAVVVVTDATENELHPDHALHAGDLERPPRKDDSPILPGGRVRAGGKVDHIPPL
jgi:phosphopantetheine--protein transferase-like protein